MVFKNLCVLVLWMNIVLALEGLTLNLTVDLGGVLQDHKFPWRQFLRSAGI